MIEEVVADHISVYPNPAKYELYIRSDSPVEKVEIYSPSGRLVASEHRFNGKIDVSRLSEGVYVLRMQVAGTWVSRKIVITR
jgi:phenolic acid decarboxylase